MSGGKALTVKEPWASAIVLWGKDVENRSRRTKYRGPLFIHAGKGWDKEAPIFICRLTGKLPIASMGHGLILGKVSVIGCHSAADCKKTAADGTESYCSAWAMADCFHWELADPSEIKEDVPAVGRLGIWNVSPKLQGD